jgi:hypothetical protein
MAEGLLSRMCEVMVTDDTAGLTAIHQWLNIIFSIIICIRERCPAACSFHCAGWQLYKTIDRLSTALKYAGCVSIPLGNLAFDEYPVLLYDALKEVYPDMTIAYGRILGGGIRKEFDNLRGFIKPMINIPERYVAAGAIPIELLRTQHSMVRMSCRQTQIEPTVVPGPHHENAPPEQHENAEHANANEEHANPGNGQQATHATANT